MMRITSLKTRDYLGERFVRKENYINVFHFVLKEINEHCTVAKEAFKKNPMYILWDSFEYF